VQLTAAKNQPAQEKPPRGAQLLPLESVAADPNEATVDNFFCVFTLSQAGHSGFLSASEKRIIISNSTPQLLQRYSYKGMACFLALSPPGEDSEKGIRRCRILVILMRSSRKGCGQAASCRQGLVFPYVKVGRAAISLDRHAILFIFLFLYKRSYL
jgi:hypothetical protein